MAKYGVIPNEMMGAYYRGLIAQLPSCPFCKNTTIYVFWLGDQKFELAQCVACQASAPIDSWRGEGNGWDADLAVPPVTD